MPYIKQIVVPTDFSDLSHKAFPWVREMAEAFEAKVTLLHILERPEDVPWWLAEQEYHARRGALESEAEGHLGKTRDRHFPGIGIDLAVRAGNPGEVIVEVAGELSADMIIIATHGRGITRFAFGSVTEYVMRHATCPVLTIRKNP